MGIYIAATLLLFAGILLGLPSWVKPRDILDISVEVPKMLLATIYNIFSKKLTKDKYIHTDHQ